ncbi:MAG: porin [Pseudomonadota bacterium]|nr:porin [Pseudomonadota bacterium]
MTRHAGLWLSTAALLLAAAPASATGFADWDLKPASVDVGGWTASLGGSANLTGYSASQDAGAGRTGGTASLFFDPEVSRLFENGWRVGLKGTINAYHDQLSGDNYGNDVFQKAYLFVATPYGRVEIGQQDGAAYKMAMTGPLVADAPAIDDANITFFRDPSTGKAFTNVFAVRSGVFATANDAKLSYYTPRLLGVQLGVSYTPHMVKDGLPFISAGPHVADRQDNLIDAAVNYTGFFGHTSLGLYAGLSAGHNAARTAGHDDLLGWALGGELDYDLGEATLALGGAYHQSNGYTLDPMQAFASGTTRVVHASTKLTMGSWLAGLEYSTGSADAEVALPKLDTTGYEASVGYALNSNLQLTAGWQHLRFTRDSGVFYNGLPHTSMDAGLLYLNFHV